MSNQTPDEIFLKISSIMSEVLNTNKDLALFLLISQTMALDSIAPQIRKKCDKIEQIRVSAELIKAGQLMGIFKNIDALSLSFTFWGAIHGMAEMKYLYDDYVVPSGEVIYSILKK